MNKEIFDKEMIDIKYKDSDPIDTVIRIKSILKTNGIDTIENWMDSGVPYCYSVTVAILGTSFVVTGKALTKDFALASAYGELMERIQFGYIGSLESQKGGNFSDCHAQDELVPADFLFATKAMRYQSYADIVKSVSNVDVSAYDVLFQLVNSNGCVLCTPFYNISTGEKDYIPYDFRVRLYSTSGCAAGNSTEEAMVQAISEIVERHNQNYVFSEIIALPDIPEEKLKDCPIAYRIIEFLRKEGFRVIIKDCSLEKKFPVVAACYIHEATGRYHIHFGAYPIFEIALERALTESFQGRHIGSFASFVDFSYQRNNHYNVANITHEFQLGCSEKHPCFFIDEPKYIYNSNVGFDGIDNKELLEQCIAYFHEMGYEILARDSSSLGFPTVQVIIPGYSEYHYYRIMNQLDTHRYHSYAISALRCPERATQQHFVGLFKHLKEMESYRSSALFIHGFLNSANISADLSKNEQKAMMSLSLAYIHFELKQVVKVVEYVDNALKCDMFKNDHFLIAIKRYFSMRLHGYSANQTWKLISYFHTNDVLFRIRKCINEQSNPFAGYVLKCGMNQCGSCVIYDKCQQMRVNELTQLVNSNLKRIDYERSKNVIIKAITH